MYLPPLKCLELDRFWKSYKNLIKFQKNNSYNNIKIYDNKKGFDRFFYKLIDICYKLQHSKLKSLSTSYKKYKH